MQVRGFKSDGAKSLRALTVAKSFDPRQIHSILNIFAHTFCSKMGDLWT